MCPPRTSSSSPETSWAPVEIRHFPCGQPATTGAPRAQRAPRGCCRGTDGQISPPPTRHFPFLCPKFPCQNPPCSRSAPSRTTNQITPVPPRQQRVRRGQPHHSLFPRSAWAAAPPLCATNLQCPRAPRGSRSAAFMPLQRVRCGDARTRDDVRTVKRRERRAPWAAAPPHCVHRVSAIPPNRLNRIATANP